MKIGAEVKIASAVCPCCGYRWDYSSGVGGTFTPTANDVSICLRCGEPAIFTETSGGLGVRTPTDAEMAEIAADAGAAEVIAAIKQLRGTL